jgi:hypothetical protein
MSKTEIHTLICHRDLLMYMTAIKSLLRFSKHFAVVAHDDGSLTQRDRALLEKHVTGIQVIPKKLADKRMADVLRRFPNCRKYRADNIMSLQLLDFAMLSERGKIVAMDSDTLFLTNPQRLIKWAAKDEQEIIHLYEVNPHQQRQFLMKLGCDYPPHFCMGLVCFYQDVVNLHLVEECLSRVDVIDWWLAQNIFPILIRSKSSDYVAACFDPSTYQDINTLKDGAIFRHYWGSRLIHKPVLKKTYAEDTRRVFWDSRPTQWNP